ncbi:MAG TPA: NHL repeat-containing protein [Verrucomicrobiae bacterium]|nr:NHL repeat-containing protein [Verrucomicrobiae bacterium]
MRPHIFRARNFAFGLCAASLVMASKSSAQEAVTTLAGSVLTSGSVDGPAASALFGDPTGLAMDASGNIYITDNQNNTIRKLSAAGQVTTIAGRAGQMGSADGVGTNALFNGPSGIAIAANGVLYVTDTGNNTIRAISTSGAVTTIAGLAGEVGATNNVGSLARFSSPLGIALDASGTIYVADSGNHLIRKVTSAGAVTTFAGMAQVWGTADGAGTNALFNGPVGLAFDASANLFVSDSANHTIRKITSDGVVTTFAGMAGMDGTADGTGSAARFGKPAELRMDRNNNLFVVDSFYHTIREISPAGVVTTVAGLGGAGGSANGLGSGARFFNPYGVVIDHNGNLRISDTYNEIIRFVYSPIPVTLTQNASGFVINWQAVSGDTYQVQFRDASTGNAWQNLGSPVTVTGALGSFTDSSTASAQRSYRVKLVQ